MAKGFICLWSNASSVDLSWTTFQSDKMGTEVWQYTKARAKQDTKRKNSAEVKNVETILALCSIIEEREKKKASLLRKYKNAKNRKLGI